MKKYFCLILAVLLCAALAGCREGAQPASPSAAAPEGSISLAPESGPGEAGGPESSSPVEEPEEERWAGPAPSVEFPLLEFHTGEDGRPDDCAVELPLLEYWSAMDPENPDLSPVNGPLEKLRREWESFRDSAEHENGGWWEVRSYPYSNRDWVQVVVHTASYPAYADQGRLLSANFDRKTGKAVTVGEALERFSLTPEALGERLSALDLAALLEMPDARLTLRELEPAAFRGRKDGSAVVFVRVLLDMVDNDDYRAILAYDTRDGSFAPFRQLLDQGEEPPNAIRYHYNQEDFPGSRPEYNFERVPAPAAEVRVALPLREYHDLNCFAEIPRLEGAEGLDEVNAPLEKLGREWREFCASADHEARIDEIYSQSMAIESYPYSNSRWTQVVVTSHRRTDAGRDLSPQVFSANYNPEEKRVVTADEMLAQKELTAGGLLERLKQEDICRILQVHGSNQYTPKTVTVRGFRGREDGSAVFYLAVDCHYRYLAYEGAASPVCTEEYDTTLLLGYDTRDDTFRDITRDLLRKWENVELPNSFDPPLRWEEDVQSPMA